MFENIIKVVSRDSGWTKKNLITFNWDNLSPFPKSCKCIFWEKLQVEGQPGRPPGPDISQILSFLSFVCGLIKSFYFAPLLPLQWKTHFNISASSCEPARLWTCKLLCQSGYWAYFLLQSMWYTVLCAVRLCTYKNIAHERQTNSREIKRGTFSSFNTTLTER